MTAWMVLAVVLGAAVGYAFTADRPETGGEKRRTALEMQLPAPAEPESGGAQDDSGEGDAQTADSDFRPLQRGGVPPRFQRDRGVDPPVAPSIGIPEHASARMHAVASGGPGGEGGDRSAPAPDDAQAAASAGAEGGWRDHTGKTAEAGERARIAVIVRGLALNAEVTRAAIERLPARVSLSFSPYGEQVRAWMQQAREAGHEVYIDLPMEPASFPVPDPGNLALRADAVASRNLERLRALLGRGSADFVGVVARYGGAIVNERERIAPILREVNARGRIYVANGQVSDSVTRTLASEMNLPHLRADVVTGAEPTSDDVERSWLAAAARRASRRGAGLALVEAAPKSVELLAGWQSTLKERGLALVPASQSLNPADGPQSASLR